MNPMRYEVLAMPGKKPTYLLKNMATHKTICSTFSSLEAANYVSMCLNLYQDLVTLELLPEVLKMLDERGA
jgi:hypothetical protein